MAEAQENVGAAAFSHKDDVGETGSAIVNVVNADYSIHFTKTISTSF